VNSADQVGVIEAAISQLQQRAQPRGPAWRERGDQGEFRDLALTDSGPAGAFHPCSRLRPKRRKIFERMLQRRFRVLRGVGKKLLQLLGLVFDGLVLLRFRQCLRSHDCLLLRVIAWCCYWLNPPCRGRPPLALIGPACAAGASEARQIAPNCC
jgi:hypothetical protein